MSSNLAVPTIPDNPNLFCGGVGHDSIDGGHGNARLSGGERADRFFQLGVHGPSSDWIQEFDSADGDRLIIGHAASHDDFRVRVASFGAGDGNVDEAFVTYHLTGQILWALVDGGDESAIQVQTGAQVFDFAL